ncbi:TAP-like protein-domain-containing protein [Cristinia sonorae]|uniref:TAP-like protein-domain-containing protein n=1 Tax=Cristinia sonorae TaxID=1940300 RepID=A0A8K0V0E6_9AGAR|nr:TAP-like protein-domain-containing protein [Cristinia sonorae]
MGDDKNTLAALHNDVEVAEPKRGRFLSKAQTVILGVGLALLALCAPPKEPVGTVKWGDCEDEDSLPGSQCGYIIVPKDYFNSSAGTTKIALGKLPAKGDSSKGTIFFNPGGPGGAGKPFVIKRGELLQTYVGHDYDLVGFDPRGIGETRPATRCFDDLFTFVDFKRNTILERSYDFPTNASIEDIRKEVLIQQREADSLLKTIFDLCEVNMGDELKYMGTATVVRDLDFMAKALDGPDALINLYGGSYGSILGQYLVNILPDRIGRVVIDGIADAVAWAGKYFLSLDGGYQFLQPPSFQAGPEGCELAHSVGEDPSEIKARVESFVNNLYYQPISVPNALHPGVLTSGRAKVFIQLALLRPSTWPTSASQIAAAMKGDGSHILDALEPKMYLDLERSAVTCNDNPTFAPPTAEDVVDELLYVYQNVSRFAFAVVTTEPDAGCEYWPVTPPERFEGPWNHTLSNTILVLSNTEDPVTPLDSALQVQDLLGDSARLLVQDGPGHVTLALPSFCTQSHVQAFFSNGTLPPKDTICKPDITPFPEIGVQSTWSAEQRRVAQAMAGLHDAMLDVRGVFKLRV